MPPDDGSFERATERCVGVGACRNTVGGVMCPSYRATGEEQHSTRGRAHLLWEMLAGSLRHEGFQSKAVHEALDLCLSCKACKSECPVQVDMAAYKSEFLAQRYKGRLHPLHHYIFGFADKLARYGSLTPALTNAILTGPMTSPLIKRIAGVASERQLPRLAAKSYQKARRARWCRIRRTESRSQSTAGPVVARHLEQLLPPVNACRCRVGAHCRPASRSRRRRGTSAAAVRSTTSACSARRAPISPTFSIGWRRRSKPAARSSFLSQAAPASSKMSYSNSFPRIKAPKRLSKQVWLLADWLAAKAPDFFLRPSSRGAHSGSRPLPSQSSLWRTCKRNRDSPPGRRHGRAHPGRLLRHGRPLWI